MLSTMLQSDKTASTDTLLRILSELAAKASNRADLPLCKYAPKYIFIRKICYIKLFHANTVTSTVTSKSLLVSIVASLN